MENTICTYSFAKTPKFLNTNNKYNFLPSIAKYLYVILLDRHCLSKTNADKWTDENGVYIKYTRLNMAQVMNCSTKTITKLMKQLRAVGLIKEKRIGLTQANHIYVVEPTASYDQPNTYPKKVNEKANNMASVPAAKEKKKIKNKQKADKADIDLQNNINIEIKEHENNQQKADYLDAKMKKREKREKKKEIKKEKAFLSIQEKNNIMSKVREQLSYSRYQFGIYKNMNEELESEEKLVVLHEIVNLISEIYSSSAKRYYINGGYIDAKIVIDQFKKIDNKCFEYIFDSLKNNNKHIQKRRQYLITVLYNAPNSINSFIPEYTETNDGYIDVQAKINEENELKSKVNYDQLRFVYANREKLLNDIIYTLLDIKDTTLAIIKSKNHVITTKEFIPLYNCISYTDIEDMLDLYDDCETVITDYKDYLYDLVLTVLKI